MHQEREILHTRNHNNGIKNSKNIIAEIDLTSGRMNFQLQKINFTLV